MTDVPSPAPAPAAAPPSPLTADQIGALRDSWTAQGLDPAAFEAALAGAPASAPGEPASGQEPGADLNTGTAKQPGLAAQQAHEMAQALRAAGVPEGQVLAALKADGFEDVPADTRTDEERQFDHAFPEARASDYHPNFTELIPEGTPISTVVELNQAAGQWAAEIGLPAEVGTAVIERVVRVGRGLDQMPSQAHRDMWVREQATLFERLAGGPEKAAERLSLAAQALRRAPKAFTDSLYSSALHDAEVVTHLALNEERRAARSAQGKSK